ncbi:uncharacterized protein V6R79_003031 [Siganus canaliculatus]
MTLPKRSDPAAFRLLDPSAAAAGRSAAAGRAAPWKSSQQQTVCHILVLCFSIFFMFKAVKIFHRLVVRKCRHLSVLFHRSSESVSSRC